MNGPQHWMFPVMLPAQSPSRTRAARGNRVKPIRAREAVGRGAIPGKAEEPPEGGSPGETAVMSDPAGLTPLRIRT
jgi:hypothetical protein